MSQTSTIKIRREKLLSGVTRLRILGTPFFIDCPPNYLLEVYGLYRRKLVIWQEIPEGQPIMHSKIIKLRELRDMPNIRTPEQQTDLFPSDQIEMFGGTR